MNYSQIFVSSLAILLTLSSCSGMKFQPGFGQDPADTVKEEALSQDYPEESHSSPYRTSALKEVGTIDEGDVEKAMKAGVLILGMTPREVITLFGRPDRVDYAGNPKSQNERWIYPNGLSDRWKLSSPRIIYFEAAQVSGWENMDSARPLFKR